MEAFSSDKIETVSSIFPQCKALAAAIFGRAANRVETFPVHASNRFVMLNNETVDVLVSSTTHTMERELHEVSG
jgi:ABC-type amino acid transport substrate-binding protein